VPLSLVLSVKINQETLTESEDIWQQLTSLVLNLNDIRLQVNKYLVKLNIQLANSQLSKIHFSNM